MDVNTVKKVLYISYDGLTDPLGQSQVLPYLQQLSKRGYVFTILSFEKKSRLEKEEKIIRAIVKESGITWVPLSFTSRPPVLAKIWDRFRMNKKAEKLFLQNKYDLIHCRSYVAAEVGLKLKKKYGAKFIFDMRGFWADEKVDNGQWDLKNPFFKRVYKTYKEKEVQFLENADGIVSLTHAATDYLHSQKDFQHLSIDVIPCCADLEHFNYKRITESEKQGLREKLSLAPGTRLVTYLGSVGGWYLTGQMFRFFAVLKKFHPEYKMLLLTKDPEIHVRNEAVTMGINPGDLIITYSDRRSLPVYLSISDFSIFFIRDSFSKKASSPTKHAELMGMGVPVICNDIGDTGHIISTTGTGLVINEFSDDEFRAAVNNLPLLLSINKEKIRESATRIFDLKSGALAYEAVYKKVLA